MINKIKIIYGGSNLIEEFNYEINGKLGTYEGNFKKTESGNIPHGNGIWKSNDGKNSEFNGKWENGKPKNGNILINEDNGNIYKGEINDNLFIGKLTEPNGFYEEGKFELKKGQAPKFIKGKVKKKLDHGIYEGEWENNKRHGRGKYTWKNGEFNGEWENGEPKNGNILKNEDNGDIYKGEINDNLFIGKLTKPNGFYEEGTFELSENNGPKFIKGKVKKLFNDDEIYEGEWENDLANGEGKLIIKNILFLDGKWIDGKPKKGTVFFYNLPLEIKYYSYMKEKGTHSATWYINKIEFNLEIFVNDEGKKFIQKINNEDVKDDIKKDFETLLNIIEYDSIKFVTAMNNILEYYKESKIPNIYKFHGLPISFESKMNLLLSKGFNLNIINLLNA